MREEQELKPCPFCGAYPDTVANYVECCNCDYQLPVYNIDDQYQEEDAIAAWNHRPIEDALRRQLEEEKHEYELVRDGFNQLDVVIAVKDAEIERLSTGIKRIRNHLDDMFDGGWGHDLFVLHGELDDLDEIIIDLERAQQALAGAEKGEGE